MSEYLFNETSITVCLLVPFPKEREKMDRRLIEVREERNRAE